MENLSYENDFNLYESEAVCGTHLHVNGLTRRLVSTEAKGTRKWPILLGWHNTISVTSLGL